MQTLTVVGMNDEQTVCDRCGKPELRGTVILADLDGVEAGRYGTTCASKVLEAANGTPVRITRDDAWRVELNRRTEVSRYLTEALRYLKAGETALAQWVISDMRRNPLLFVHRDEEREIVERIDATGGYVSLGREVSPEAIRRNYDQRVASGRARFGTSVSPEWMESHRENISM